MPKFMIQYVRMERQLGMVEIEAPSLKAAKIEAANRAGEMRSRNHSRGPESWEQDVDGHKIIVGCVEPRWTGVTRDGTMDRRRHRSRNWHLVFCRPTDDA